MNIEELKPLEINPFKGRGDNQIKQIAKSIESFEKMMSIRKIVIDENNNILGGNKRYFALKWLGYKEIPDEWIDKRTDLTTDEKQEFTVKDNAHWGSEWDLEILADWEVPLLEWGVEFDLDLSLAEEKKGLTDDDDIPEEVEPICKTGDLWQLGEHRLLCGDATKKEDVERLMDGKKADMVFADPPYGIDYSGGRTQVVAKKQYGKIAGDKNKDISGFIRAIKEIAGNKDYYICLSPINLKSAINEIEEYKAIIVWKKPQPGLGYQWVRRYCEFIIFETKRIKHKTDKSEFDFWDIATDKKTEYEHGTQKPVAIPLRAIQFSSVKNDNVWDGFLGSGSTLIACEKTNRKCYGMEIDEHYCDVIIKRWEEYTGKEAIKV